jgi:hypothetical protein
MNNADSYIRMALHFDLQVACAVSAGNMQLDNAKNTGQLLRLQQPFVQITQKKTAT